ncbi:MAG: hypothetical protein KatS3mg121_0240 [Gammaproteobacteria bacterium]|nr:MAG: hypothetical protein KatS3mg121_0240 [Gammaproteobacteria bacterium]
MTVLVTPRRGDAVQDFFDSEEFTADVEIPPYRSGSFEIGPDQTDLEPPVKVRVLRAWGW